MIPDLLWRCPLCATLDAVQQKKRWFSGDQISCSHCKARWDVIRRKGDDYYLRLLSPEPHPDEKELPLWAWYERMKKDFTPQPLSDHPQFLREDEKMYLEGKSVKFYTQGDNPEFFKKIPRSTHASRLVYPFMRRVGKGKFFLTSQRLIWQRGDSISSFWFKDLDSVYIEASHYLGLALGTRIYKFKLKESYLKWLTHIVHLAARKTGHIISFSNY